MQLEVVKLTINMHFKDVLQLHGDGIDGNKMSISTSYTDDEGNCNNNIAL